MGERKAVRRTLSLSSPSELAGAPGSDSSCVKALWMHTSADDVLHQHCVPHRCGLDIHSLVFG